MQYIQVIKCGTILQVTLNRPEKRNAFDAVTISELTEVFSERVFEAGIRLVQIQAAGPDFCVGADLQWMAGARNLTSSENIADVTRLWQLYECMQNCPVPIITRVHGRVFGGGIGLSAASDIVVADPSAVFALSEVKRGLVPGVMMPFIVQKLGLSRSRELTLTAREFGAPEALNYGLVHFVSAAHDNIFETLTNSILASGPESLCEARKILAHLSSSHIDRNYFIASLAKIRTGTEANEGIQAFFENRDPQWVL